MLGESPRGIDRKESFSEDSLKSLRPDSNLTEEFFWGEKGGEKKKFLFLKSFLANSEWTSRG